MEEPACLLIGDSIALTPIHFSHAKALFALIEKSRHTLRQWLPWVDFVQEIGDLLQLISYYRHKFSSNGALTCCIMVKNDIAGIIGLNSVNWEQRSATVGYWLGEPYRGQGLMVRSCKRLVDHSFSQMQLHKIHILCAVENRASQRIPIALHFRHEGTLRDGEWLNDHYVDLHTYGILRHHWHV